MKYELRSRRGKQLRDIDKLQSRQVYIQRGYSPKLRLPARSVKMEVKLQWTSKA